MCFYGIAFESKHSLSLMENEKQPSNATASLAIQILSVYIRIIRISNVDFESQNGYDCIKKNRSVNGYCKNQELTKKSLYIT